MRLPSFSELLADRRHVLGYTTAKASRDLGFREEALIAFEQADFRNMPKAGYALGMLSSYARYLGLDDHEICALYQQALDEHKKGTSVHTPPSRRGLALVSDSNRSSDGASHADEVRTMGNYVSPRPYSRRTSNREGSSSQVRRAARRVEDERRSVSNKRLYDPYAESHAAAQRASSKQRDAGIKTWQAAPGEYKDDLRIDVEASPYEAASSQTGRQSSRNIASIDRPNIQRQPSYRQRQQVSSRTRQSSSARRSASNQENQPARLMAVIILAVAVILTVIISFSVASCTSAKTHKGTGKSVPTSSAAPASSASDTTNASDQAAASANSNTAKTPQASSQSGAVATKIDVSIAKDQVSWLEIENGGTSEVAETITGPWSQSYEVNDSINVRAGNPGAVSVTSSGKQVPFDTMASGLGTLTLQGPKKTTQETGSGSSSDASDVTSKSSNKSSNSKSSSSSKDSSSSTNSQTSDDDNSSSSSSKTKSAKTGNGSSSSASSTSTKSSKSSGGSTTSALGSDD